MRQHDSHESYEVFAGRLHWIGAIIAVSLGGIVWLMYLLAHTWLAPLPGPPGMPPPAAPRLQRNPHPDLEAVRTRERAALEGYRWIDPQRGIAHIPIERAIELMAQSDATHSPNGHTIDPTVQSEPSSAARRSNPAGQHLQPPPDLARRVGVDQHLGATLPTGLTFRDSNGAPVSLERLGGGGPLLLALGYYDCPNLCDTELRGIGRSVGSLALQPGRDFQVAFVSIDPHETPRQAAEAAHTLARDLPSAEVPRWHLLTGEDTQIQRLAAALGYRYWFDARNGQYAHSAGLVVITSSGRIAQYFFGVSFPPAPLRLALVGASHGQLGTLLDQLVLLCCGYDPTTGRYSLLIGRIAIVVCGGFLLLAGAWLWLLRRRTRA
jgi:protein SCO1/2